MQNHRDKIQEFISNNFDDIIFKSTISKDVEPRLRYFIIDRYDMCYIYHGVPIPRKLTNFTNRFRDVDVFFSLGYLCIGYSDPQLGIGTHCMKLDDFVSRSPQICSCQVDKPQGVKQ